MEVLVYNNITYHKLKKPFDKTVARLAAGEFPQMNVQKISNTDLYSAKLDTSNSILFKIADFKGNKYILVLEVIPNSDFSSSRFIGDDIPDNTNLNLVASEKNIKREDITTVGFLNSKHKKFHILDKIISFDDTQEDVFNLPLPVIIIGSAGSGKTALTLEKAKSLPGRVLYTTLSPYLVENAQNIYYANNYENSAQEIEFLSFNEFLSTFQIPAGKDLDFYSFDQWARSYRQSHKIKDTYKVFEEFKGVLTGSIIEKPYLSEEEYIDLGIKQSIFSKEERNMVYDLFRKYLQWLPESGFFDSNLIAYELLNSIQPQYDYVVVDEVQDITNVQLSAILKSLTLTTNFILCGDSNQIVHPNFFSWSRIKSMFYKQDLRGDIIRVLATNYRNTPEVTAIANRLLMIKNARFGSIDKESTYLVKPNSTHEGIVEFLENQPKINADLNRKTNRSAKFAVLVLRNEDKAEAKRHFNTPLLFSVQEAKGLEYENIILFNTISNYDKEFRELTNGVSLEDIKEDNLRFSRGKDKADKSLDEYKFYVNALYVSITRAVKNLYIVETNKKHALLQLLGLTHIKQLSSLKDQLSSQEDWQKEARRLEMQGKKEQAEAIRQQILHVQPVPWEIITRAKFQEVVQLALHPDQFNKKAKDRLFEYALFYNETAYFHKLSALKYRPADKWEQEGKGIQKRMFSEYISDNLKAILPKLQRYGVDFRNELNLTPFMISIHYGSENILKHLLENGAKTELTDNYGRNALHMVIAKGYAQPEPKSKSINKLYGILKGNALRLKVKNRLVKIDSHQAEYLMFNFMFATIRTQLIQASAKQRYYYGDELKMPTFQTKDFLVFFEGLSESVLPQYRKKRPYISSILGKNEISGGDKYNKQLFLRVKTGHYLPNPDLSIMIEDKWINLYDLIDLAEIIAYHTPLMSGMLEQILHYRESEV